MHGYNNAFNAGYGIYGNSNNNNNSNAADSFFQPSSALFNNQQHNENDSNVNNLNKTTATSATTAASSGIPSTNDMYQQPQQQYNNMQSFYPYYYMQNQFNAYSSYGQPSLNQRYEQSGATNLNNSMASHYGGTSSAYSNQLYGGFDDFGLGSNQQTTSTSPDANKKSTTPATTVASTTNIQQPYANYFNGQSPMFSSYGQQNRSNGNQQYWNQ
jgi:hypothetical protein